MNTRIAAAAPYWILVLALFSNDLFVATCRAEMLLSDDFNTGDQVNPVEWRVPFGGDGSFLGRTQLKVDNAQLPSIAGGAAIFELDTFLDGTVFSGHEMITKRNFALGGGLVWKARMKLGSSTPNGVVGGGFLFDVAREIPAGTPVRDEIDVELLSNEANGGDRVLTNTWNDENFINGAGDSAFVPAAVPPASPYNLHVYHDYEIRWTPGRVQYAIDDVVVRTVVGDEVPNDPMSARFNIWAPDGGFTEAFDAALQPAANSGANATYTMEVDSVSIERVNTTTSGNLLVNGSFEDAADPETNWTLFNNALEDNNDLQVPRQDGDWTIKAFGPNRGFSDASGAFQTVSGISPGKEYSASVYAWSDSVDSIVGNDNFGQIVLAFKDGSGNTIEEKTTPIYDGRDPLLTVPGVQDAWNKYVVEGLAPAGTTQAVVSLFFVQIVDPNAGGGSIWYDNAALVQLIAEETLDAADWNRDGRVDATDLATWQGAFGNSNLGDADGDGDSDGADFLTWQRQFTGPAAVPALASVPEPSSWLTAIVSCTLAIRRRPR